MEGSIQRNSNNSIRFSFLEEKSENVESNFKCSDCPKLQAENILKFDENSTKKLFDDTKNINVDFLKDNKDYSIILSFNSVLNNVKSLIKTM